MVTAHHSPRPVICLFMSLFLSEILLHSGDWENDKFGRKLPRPVLNSSQNFPRKATKNHSGDSWPSRIEHSIIQKPSKQGCLPLNHKFGIFYAVVSEQVVVYYSVALYRPA
jgi:hypothetical protein